MFCSGQVALTPSGDLKTSTIAEQTRQCCDNLTAVLDAAGLSMSNIVKTTIFLSSMDHFGAVNEIYGSYFDSEPPARSTIAVAGLPKNVDVEIEAIAVY
jgi:2-iminobutanoate/2-iminopropanoate deaminase